jgi:hypothetical protein
MAAIAGIAASTLRAYSTRNEAEVPLPQAVISGRSLWSRPVAEDWGERRQRSPEGVTEAVSDGHPVTVGEAELADGLARSFYAVLWDYRPYRGRWALRWRNVGAVREVADRLAGDAAEYILRRLVPGQALTYTVSRAVLWEFADWQRNHGGEDQYYPIGRPVGMMLGWLVRHKPASAQSAIAETTRDAEADLGIPPALTERSVRTSLGLDSKLDAETLNEYLRRVLTPASDAR